MCVFEYKILQRGEDDTETIVHWHVTYCKIILQQLGKDPFGDLNVEETTTPEPEQLLFLLTLQDRNCIYGSDRISIDQWSAMGLAPHHFENETNMINLNS